MKSESDIYGMLRKRAEDPKIHLTGFMKSGSPLTQQQCVYWTDNGPGGCSGFVVRTEPVPDEVVVRQGMTPIGGYTKACHILKNVDRSMPICLVFLLEQDGIDVWTGVRIEGKGSLWEARTFDERGWNTDLSMSYGSLELAVEFYAGAGYVTPGETWFAKVFG